MTVKYNIMGIDPNSYSFHLGEDLLIYHIKENSYLDSYGKLEYSKEKINSNGIWLEPNIFYLGYTMEKMGSNYYAQTLHANLSTSLMGMWIQFSAPLGHTGAIINWTLEIMVTQPTKIYPFIKIGKIAFWDNYGNINCYHGRYAGSFDVVPSKIIEDSYGKEIL